MEKLRGIITAVSYQSEDTGFTVLKLTPDGSVQTVTCVGPMPTVKRGESLVVSGTWSRHERFGPQFTVSAYEITRPVTAAAVEQYLASGLIATIGPVRAKKIVETFGAQALDILDSDPDRLGEVPGIGKKMLGRIKESIAAHSRLRELMLFLHGFGVSVNLALKVYKAYGDKAKEVISQDPYSLVRDIWGVGFVKADAIAQKLGFTTDSYRRIRAGLTFALQQASEEGHVFLSKEQLLETAAGLLNVETEKILFSFDHAAAENLFIAQEQRVYLPSLYNAECDVGSLLGHRIAVNVIKDTASHDRHVDSWIEQYSRTSGWNGDPRQIEAVRYAACSPILLLTGGPGTGKTTTLQVIVSFLQSQHYKVLLAAPTGRAAQRMGSVAGVAAQTIHRLLEFGGIKNGWHFGRTAENPLEADVVILDEVSMVDLNLMRSFLSALRNLTRVIFVGDNNQLPSVGPGSVLTDLIRSGHIPHVHLTTIFRQAAQSTIVRNAHTIVRGEIPVFTNTTDDNCFFIEQDDPDACCDTIVDLVARRLPARYGFDPVADIQVLSPLHRGVLGTVNLTRLLQDALNKSPRRIERNGVFYVLGDKVLQLRNNYDMGVYNGDIGRIVNIADESDTSGTGMGLTVDFDGRIVEYDFRDLDELVPAYCMSIHKSQGCEFTAVVLPVVTQHYIMLQRTLLYTAVTRARKLCVCVGSKKALSLMVSRNEVGARNSFLAERIREGCVPSFEIPRG